MNISAGSSGAWRRVRTYHHLGGLRTLLRSTRGGLAAAAFLFLAGCSSSAGAGSEAAPLEASSQPSPSGVVIRRADFQIAYVLDGVSQTGIDVQLMSNPQLAFVPSVRANSDVAGGDVVGRAVIDPNVRAALAAGSATSSLDKGELAQLRRLEGPVVSPVSGVFSMAAGRPIVEDPGVDVVIGLTPIQSLRYESLQFTGEASIETIIGQRQVPCVTVWVEQAGSLAKSAVGLGGAYQLHCRLPSYVETGAGLPSQVSLKSALYKSVIVVPNVYVGYDPATDGYFINVTQGGQEGRLPITVGVTDGVVRIVTSSVPIGATLAPIGGT